jgi:CBS domain containing-hemolysin-like protein
VIWLVLLLIGLGVFLSAFFSGNETGFYRVTRVRLLLDGLDGDSVSRALLALTNRPVLFVATALIGNNVANYITSLGIVLAVETVSPRIHLAELVAPIAMSPVLFVYCELLPKQLFFHRPNRLLRRSGPLLLLFMLLFLPIAVVLATLGRVLEALVGQTPLRVKLTLARKELQQMFQEGHEAGILRPAQRDLAHRLFANASRNILVYSTPLNRVTSVPLGTRIDVALRLARRHRSSVVPVHQPSSRQVIGYVRVIDLRLTSANTIETVRTFPKIARHESHIQALMHLQSRKAEVASVVDQDNRQIALVFTRDLTKPLFQEV